jgi:hypothetical protein
VSLNNHQPHVLVLPEDDANRHLANEFKLNLDQSVLTRIHVDREPEDLKPELGSYETIGSALAQDCREETDTTWNHELLRHNSEELARLRVRVRPILFP